MRQGGEANERAGAALPGFREGSMHINPQRLKARIDAINALGQDPSGGYTRLAFSEKDRQARALIKEMMWEAGLRTGQDAAGNIWGDLCDSRPAKGFIASGSHIDTVQNGGPFDGLLGSIAAIEVLQSVNEQTLSLKRPLRAIVFSDEEGARFGSGMIGSKSIAGSALDAPLESYVDKAGTSLTEAMESLGLDPRNLSQAKAAQGTYQAFVELHIEQSVVLEQHNRQIGIVTGIKGPYWMRGSFFGESNHAGGTPMNLRHDALVAAANFAAEAERIASKLGEQFVATIGVLEVHPGGINTIPGRVDYTVDIRDLDMARRAQGIEMIERAAATSAAQFGVEHRSNCIKCADSAAMNPAIMQTIEEVCKTKGLPHMRLPSGAFHDTLSMQEICDVGMIFVPSIGGISHSPKENSRWEDIYAGAEVLYSTLVSLASI